MFRAASCLQGTLIFHVLRVAQRMAHIAHFVPVSDTVKIPTHADPH